MYMRGRDSKNQCYITYRKALARQCPNFVYGYTGKFRVPAVLRLAIGTCPFAIFGIVPLTVINTFQVEIAWARPHICQEIFKRLHPSVTNLDSPRAVIFKIFVCWSETACFHFYPYSVYVTHGVILFCKKIHVLKRNRVSVSYQRTKNKTIRLIRQLKCSCYPHKILCPYARLNLCHYRRSWELGVLWALLSCCKKQRVRVPTVTGAK